MRPHLSLLWITREGTSFKDCFPGWGFCPVQSKGRRSRSVILAHGSATELAFDMLGQLPSHSGCFQSAPLNHWYGEAMEVYPQDSLFSAQGWCSLNESHGEWGSDLSQLECGAGGCHLPGPERSRSSLQRSGDGWIHCCSPAHTRSDCTGVSLLLGYREAASLASETGVVNAT